MPRLVMKFGGTSVATVERIRNVARHVKREVEAGAALPRHSHPHEQVVNMLEGEFELVVDGTPHRLKAGDVLAIPGDAPHSGRALTRCRILDVFHPIREDYRFG